MALSKEYRLDLDLKNRVMISAKLRGSLGSKLILCLAQNDEHGLYRVYANAERHSTARSAFIKENLNGKTALILEH